MTELLGDYGTDLYFDPRVRTDYPESMESRMREAERKIVDLIEGRDVVIQVRWRCHARFNPNEEWQRIDHIHDAPLDHWTRATLLVKVFGADLDVESLLAENRRLKSDIEYWRTRPMSQRQQ